MGRALRTELPDGLFHVTARGVGGTAIAHDEHDWARLARLIVRVGDAIGWVVHTRCLMTTHYHVVVETTREHLSRGIQQINGTYARRFNERHNRFGHVFAERFWSRAIEDADYYENVCAYVLDNPVRAGLCATWRDWPWSWSRYGADTVAR